ncbi:MAG: hypothetical protein ACRELA_13420 [Candidatus Rokuibacteriota bacterium]
MAPEADREVTLHTLHEDLGELRSDLRELKTVVASGLRAFSPEWAGDVVRLLRETNRLNEERFAQLDVALREQALETHTILRALAEGHRQLVDEQRQLVLGQRGLSEDIRALIARIDALIKGRDDGSPSRSPN